MNKHNNMKAARINYVGAAEIEYTEIRPIRPNQSVILAGLGVTGSKVTANTKDRRYRSTQGAGYEDGLVIHSRPATQDSKHQSKKNTTLDPGALWSSAASLITDKRTVKSSGGVNTAMDSIYPHYDLRNQRILFEDEVFVTVPSSTASPTARLRSTSVSPVRSPQQNMNKVASTKSVSTTYDLFFDQHLQNIASVEEESPSSRLSFSSSATTPVTARFREASCQTPTDLSLRLSPMITSKMEASQTDLSVPKIVEECLQEEQQRKEKPELDELTDDELELIGEYMVKESLDVAANDLDHGVKDFTDLGGELSSADLRDDQFVAKDYYRSGLTIPDDMRQDPSMGDLRYRCENI